MLFSEVACSSFSLNTAKYRDGKCEEGLIIVHIEPFQKESMSDKPFMECDGKNSSQTTVHQCWHVAIECQMSEHELSKFHRIESRH